MKSVYFLILAGFFSTIWGCNPFKSDHPQAAISTEHNTNLTAKNILQYADSIDQKIQRLTKTSSLVYLLGEQSFYVEKYTDNGTPILLVEHTANAGNNKSLKHYYFKNDSLVLERSSTETGNADGKIFKNVRTFLRSNTVFKQENRTAASLSAINSLPYIDVPLSQNATADQTYLSNVSSLNDVVDGKDKFEMVFENITTYPDSRYIILRSKIQNSYMASILVREKDPFIDSLLNDPIDFKDQKLNLNWEIKDHEAIYVPVASNTSANGLNK
jgi:hypothetical protein